MKELRQLLEIFRYKSVSIIKFNNDLDIYSLEALLGIIKPLTLFTINSSIPKNWEDTTGVPTEKDSKTIVGYTSNFDVRNSKEAEESWEYI